MTSLSSRVRRGVPLLALTLIAACGNTAVAPTAQPSEWAVQSTSAKGPLDKVTWDLPYGEPSSLDWPLTASFSENTVLANLCESLVRMTPDFKYAPGLATSVTQPTPTTWVYTIRQGVTFWDGTPLTADDVAFSLNRHLDPSVGSFWNNPWYTKVKSITKTAPDEVTVTLTQPDSAFNQIMATAGGVVGEMAYVKAKGKSYGTASGGVMCTGPYKFDHWTPGSGITIIRNDHYWDTARPQPKTREVDFTFVTNASTLTSALESGQIDGAYETPITALQKLQSGSSGKLYLGKSTLFGLVAFTTKQGPIQDPRIRQALSLAIDRKAIVNSVFHGSAVPIKSLAFPNLWGYAPSTYQTAYAALPGDNVDLAKAKALVTAAGTPAQEMTLLTSADDPADTQTATYLGSVAKSLGLNLKIVAVPASQAIAIQFDPKQRSQYDMMLQFAGYNDIADAIEQALFTLLPGSLYDYNDYSNAVVTQELNDARSASDDTTRATLITKALAQALGVDTSLILLVNYAERLYMDNRVTGAIATLPAYLYYPWAADLGSTS
jgi:peptide/nickel transport system substrate-binding protein